MNPDVLKLNLNDVIEEVEKHLSDYLIDPTKNFTRKRKLDFSTIMSLLIGMSGIFLLINESLYEPVEMWWLQSKIDSCSFNYALGAEVPIRYNSIIPKGFDLIELAPCSMILFQANHMNRNETFDIHKKLISIFQNCTDMNDRMISYQEFDLHLLNIEGTLRQDR